MQAKAKMEMAGEVMERGLKKLEIGKIGRYATPFDATKNTPMKGDGKSDGRKIWWRHVPCKESNCGANPRGGEARGRKGKGETSGYPLLVMKKIRR